MFYFNTCFLSVLLCVFDVSAWDNHALLTHLALSHVSEFQKPNDVLVETLEQFLLKEQQHLPVLLETEERWAKKHVAHYPARPSALRFKPSEYSNVVKTRFLQAIRVNPNMKLNLYYQILPGEKKPAKGLLPKEAISLLPQFLMPSETFMGLKTGQTISALKVITAASDEPDYGMDLELWENNQSAMGHAYRFGNLPFGDPQMPFSSQAPFHMGFYHEADVIYQVAPYLRRTLPEYRIHLFDTLSQFAFKTGHPYWGYRFAGWGLHYIQDLTQPYHSTVAPGESAWKILWVGALDILGIHGPKNRLLQKVSDAHAVIENAFYESVVNALLQHDHTNRLIVALQNTQNDKHTPHYSPTYVHNTLTRESNRASKNAAFLVEHVSDKERSQKLDDLYASLAEKIGIHTRNWVGRYKQHTPSK